ncbi:MAG: hypothetical protein DRO09_00390 [Thermoprotei archaeon]|nr:MAG: hypothetical protein DRO09_00390 [Thermoprotei archaeon]
MTGVIVVGRHKFTPRQEELMRRAGLKEVARIQMIENVGDVVEKAKMFGAHILVQALPLPLLSQLLSFTRREGVKVYGFDIQAIETFEGTYEEAKKRAEELGADIVVPDPRSGNVRISKTRALVLFKRITVESEDVVV